MVPLMVRIIIWLQPPAPPIWPSSICSVDLPQNFGTSVTIFPLRVSALTADCTFVGIFTEIFPLTAENSGDLLQNGFISDASIDPFTV